jgi:putative endonuclease
MTNRYHTVYYTGITNNLIRRVYEHKEKLVDGFTKSYNCNQLIYFEQFSDPANAIIREKQVKDYRREKKLELIQKLNPEMSDLYYTLT